ncbi:MAG: hypothetical protein OXI91_05915 [Chloroflexota bacterium]|nr:hypothetical protein [Chloroflexota bacterium]
MAANSLQAIRKSQPAVALAMLGFPWVADGISDAEASALTSFAALGETDPLLLERVVNLPWVADPPDLEPLWFVRSLAALAEHDPILARHLADLPWANDGASPQETEAIKHIAVAAEYDLPLARHFATFPWIEDGVNEIESGALVDLAYIGQAIARQSPQRDVLLGALRAISWVNDGISMEELAVLYNINRLSDPEAVAAAILSAQSSSRFAAAVVPTPTPTPLPPGPLGQMRGAPWYQDGLTREEEFLAATIGFSSVDSERYAMDLVRNPLVQSKTLVLPSGEVTLIVISALSWNRGEEALDALQTAVETIEEFMGIPWPDSEALLLLFPHAESDFERLGRMTTTRGGYRMVVMYEPETSPGFAPVLYHEVAHYYWHRTWFREAVAEFFGYYTLHKTRGAPLRTHAGRGRCPVETIHEFKQATNGGLTSSFTPLGACAYTLGSTFLVEAYKTVGHDVFQASLHTLYYDFDFSDPEVKFYRLLLANSSPDKHADLEEVYRTYIGGPIPSG